MNKQLPQPLDFWSTERAQNKSPKTNLSQRADSRSRIKSDRPTGLTKSAGHPSPSVRASINSTYTKNFFSVHLILLSSPVLVLWYSRLIAAFWFSKFGSWSFSPNQLHHFSKVRTMCHCIDISPFHFFSHQLTINFWLLMCIVYDKSVYM